MQAVLHWTQLHDKEKREIDASVSAWDKDLQRVICKSKPSCKGWSNTLLNKTKEGEAFWYSSPGLFCRRVSSCVRCQCCFIPIYTCTWSSSTHTSVSSHAYGRAAAALNSSIIPLSTPFKKNSENYCTKHILQKLDTAKSLGKRLKWGWWGMGKPTQSPLFVSPCCDKWGSVNKMIGMLPVMDQKSVY